jgi:hypothetical protein
MLLTGGRRHHRFGRVSRVRRAVEFDDRRGHRVGPGGGEEDRPVLRFDASDLGGEEGEGTVLEVGDAGDARPSRAGLKLGRVGEDLCSGSEGRV